MDTLYKEKKGNFLAYIHKEILPGLDTREEICNYMSMLDTMSWPLFREMVRIQITPHRTDIDGYIQGWCQHMKIPPTIGKEHIEKVKRYTELFIKMSD